MENVTLIKLFLIKSVHRDIGKCDITHILYDLFCSYENGKRSISQTVFDLVCFI